MQGIHCKMSTFCVMSTLRPTRPFVLSVTCCILLILCIPLAYPPDPHPLWNSAIFSPGSPEGKGGGLDLGKTEGGGQLVEVGWGLEGMEGQEIVIGLY